MPCQAEFGRSMSKGVGISRANENGDRGTPAVVKSGELTSEYMPRPEGTYMHLLLYRISSNAVGISSAKNLGELGPGSLG